MEALKKDKLSGIKGYFIPQWNEFGNALKHPAYWVLMSVFFPYFNFIMPVLGKSHYTQIYPVVICFIYGLWLLLKKKDFWIKLPLHVYLMLGYFFIAFIIYVISAKGSYLNSIRDIYGYISLAIIAFVVMAIFLLQKKIFGQATRHAIIIFVFVGIIQTLINNDFLLPIISTVQSTEILRRDGRGVLSLAPEPTHFGFIMAGFLLISIMLNFKKLFLFLCIGSIFFLAKSAAAVFLLCCAFGIVFLFYKRWLFFICVLSGVIFFYLIGSGLLFSDISVRAIEIIRKLYSEPHATFLDDASVNNRINSMWVPIYASIKNFTLPFGFDSLVWASQGAIIESNFPKIIKLIDKTRIGTANAMMIFQTGFTYIVFLSSMVGAIRNLIKKESRKKKIVLSLLFLLYGFQYISPAFTMLGVLLGFIMGLSIEWKQKEALTNKIQEV